MFLSALSQMWVFALYELLRTWNGRVRKLFKLKDSGQLDKFIADHADSGINLAQKSQHNHAVRMKNDPAFSDKLKKQKDDLKQFFNFLNDLRITLAKHEVPGEARSIAYNPGYARINMHCGALDFMAHNKEGMQFRINRRDLADMLRALEESL